jgi:hypothetical protein
MLLIVGFINRIVDYEFFIAGVKAIMDAEYAEHADNRG